MQSGWFDWFMVFNATFNNISVISWRSDLLVEKIGVTGEIYQPVAITDKLSVKTNFLLWHLIHKNSSYKTTIVIFLAQCMYNGVPFTQGQTWNDGCDLTCSCENATTGYYRCSTRYVCGFLNIFDISFKEGPSWP